MKKYIKMEVGITYLKPNTYHIRKKIAQFSLPITSFLIEYLFVDVRNSKKVKNEIILGMINIQGKYVCRALIMESQMKH